MLGVPEIESMRSLRLPAVLLSTLAVLLTVAVAEAAKPLPQRSASRPRAWSAPVRPVGSGGLCTHLGVDGIGASVDTLDFVFPPDDYFTVLDPANCGGCESADSTSFTTVHLPLFFTVPCALPMSVTVYGAPVFSPFVPYCDTLLADRMPIIYPPTPFTVTGNDPMTRVTFDLTLPFACRFAGKAVLRVSFVADVAACDSAATRPRLYVASPCTNCISFNASISDAYGDACSEVAINPVMWVDVDSCFQELVPPAPVRDLAVVDAVDTVVTLRWTESGDNGLSGRCEAYPLRVWTGPADSTQYDGAPIQVDVPSFDYYPTQETYVLNGLGRNQTYHAALKARDHAGNLSPISNVTTFQIGFTPPPPPPGGATIVSKVQPARIPVELAWRASSPAPAAAQTIVIYDLAGSARRTFDVGTAHEGVVMWDGRDDDDRKCPAGVYFARFTTGPDQVQTRVVLLK